MAIDNIQEITAQKDRQQKAWATGDFSALGVKVLLVGERLCEAVDLHSGQKVLDVATGSGNTALAAARRDCDVTGIDFVEALLEQARLRAATERLKINFQSGDAEDLRFPESSFDAVLSTFGVMFAPFQEKAVRSCCGSADRRENWPGQLGPGRFRRRDVSDYFRFPPAAP